MRPSIPWSSSVSVFIIERMAIIHSLKCTVPFSFVVPLVSLAVSHYHLLSLVVTRCITRCHSLYQSMLFTVTRCYSLSFVVPHVVTRCHSLSLVVPLAVTCCTTWHSLYHSLSLDVPLVCLFMIGKLCFTQFSKTIYWNRSLATSDLFPMFAQSINYYTFYCRILKKTDVWKM